MRRINKKGQMQQVFVFILAALLFGGILLYGYRSINDFIDRSRQVSLLELRTELVTTIDAMTTGSDVRRATFQIPPGITHVCFLDTNLDRVPISYRSSQAALCNPPSPANPHYFPLICNAWLDNVDQNIYFYPMTDVELRSEPIEVIQPDAEPGSERGFLCIPVKQDRISVLLEGKGDRTLIEEVVEG